MTSFALALRCQQALGVKIKVRCAVHQRLFGFPVKYLGRKIERYTRNAAAVGRTYFVSHYYAFRSEFGFLTVAEAGSVASASGGGLWK